MKYTWFPVPAPVGHRVTAWTYDTGLFEGLVWMVNRDTYKIEILNLTTYEYDPRFATDHYPNPKAAREAAATYLDSL